MLVFSHYVLLVKKNANATGLPLTPPLKFIPVVTVIGLLSVVLIVFPVIFILPAVTALTFRELLPPPICELMYVIIALCVGTTLSEFALNVPSVVNSLITAPPCPKPTAPSDNSCSPAKLNALVFKLALPVDCSTLNNLPTLKLPSWSVLV